MEIALSTKYNSFACGHLFTKISPFASKFNSLKDIIKSGQAGGEENPKIPFPLPQRRCSLAKPLILSVAKE